MLEIRRLDTQPGKVDREAAVAAREKDLYVWASGTGSDAWSHEASLETAT